MQKQRKLTEKTRGMFAGPRGSYGQYVDSNIGEVSGTTYGGQGLGWFWQGYPAVIGGLTEYDPRALQPGSNLSAVQQDSTDLLALKAGMSDGVASGASVGGTAPYMGAI
jgi:hypothetical protein